MRLRPPPHPSCRNPLRGIPVVYCLLLLLALLFPYAAAKSSRGPITDNEIREKKDACYTDIENGLWGRACKSSATEKENCVLRCLSPECYELIYGGDPLEEGELDYVRGQEYKYCMHKLNMYRLAVGSPIDKEFDRSTFARILRKKYEAFVSLPEKRSTNKRKLEQRYLR